MSGRKTAEGADPGASGGLGLRRFVGLGRRLDDDLAGRQRWSLTLLRGAEIAPAYIRLDDEAIVRGEIGERRVLIGLLDPGLRIDAHRQRLGELEVGAPVPVRMVGVQLERESIRGRGDEGTLEDNHDLRLAFAPGGALRLALGRSGRRAGSSERE